MEDFNFSQLLIPFLLVKGAIFHGGMIPQNVQPISERSVYYNLYKHNFMVTQFIVFNLLIQIFKFSWLQFS